MHSFSEWLKRKRKALGALAAVLVVAGTAWLYAGAAGSEDGGGRLAERQQAEPDGGAAAERQPAAGAGAEAGTAPSPDGGSAQPAASAEPGAGGSAGPQPSAGAAEPPTGGGTGTAQPSATPAAGGSGGASPPAPAGSAATSPRPAASPAAPPAAGASPSAAPAKTAPPPSGAKPGGGSAAASPAAKPSRADTVSLSVTGPAETGAILSKQAIAVEKGDTVLDVLKRATRAAKVQMEYSGEGAGAYVSGIGNVYQFDEGPGSGWLYSVGGEFPSKSAGAVKVEPGDVIEWRYTLDYGDDLGAPSAQQGGG
ncbi:DUF4430 domain-containing protein [Paenibacillus sp. B01]|uniref:DUF4430 domain-containing protein n=1 Tax=Paenibacillus sp. B01 TaxID=2660554 RepID=UPI00129A687D|nr:DUF4430 domain-containing protein [Paenibacillus sp. B01]QGG57928.1 DUF4430 domain-containing protein [Paenibacillus sp. B01]